jgi:HSP20 family protein
MTIIRRPSPFGELLSLRQAMDRLFEESFVRPRGTLESDDQPLALDVYSTSDAVVVEAALPGVRPEDVDVSVLGDRLTITASTRDEKATDEEGYSYREIRRGHFSRSLDLPTDVNADAASATFENGLLRLSIPKAEQVKPRQIRISGTNDESVSSDRPPAGESAGASREQER